MKNKNGKFWIKVIIYLILISLELAFDVLLLIMVLKFINGVLF